MTSARCATRWPAVSSRHKTWHCCSSATSPRNWPGPLDGPRAAGQERRLDGQDHQNPSGSRWCARLSTSPPAGTANLPRSRRPSTGWTTSPASKSSWHRREMATCAAWRPATCSPPPSNPPRYHRSPGTGALNMNDGCTHLDRIAMLSARPGVARTAWPRDARTGCICGSARNAVTPDAVTTLRAGPPPRTSAWPGTPVIRSYETGEDWHRCYLGQSVFEL
jgi:hypothetical protein